jgi:hypothetical protein
MAYFRKRKGKMRRFIGNTSGITRGSDDFSLLFDVFKLHNNDFCPKFNQ